MFYTSASFAQRNLSKFTFAKPMTINPFFAPSLYSFNKFSHYNNIVQGVQYQAIPNNFHYTAFFCKMELKAMNHFGIWIKVHVGDYDNYSKTYYRK